MNVVVDIGNSTLKWAVAPALDQIQRIDAWEVQRLPHATAKDVEKLVELRHQIGTRTDWWISSVFQDACDRLVSAIRQRLPEDAIHVITSSDAGLELEVDQPNQVGTDRVMGALAISRRKKLNEYGIVVDFGTATTINVISDSSRFMGGCIVPGIQSQLLALTRSTDQLPLVEWRRDLETNLIGRNTQDAMLSGIKHSHQHGVVGVVKQIQAALNMPSSIWMTGGGIPDPSISESLNAEVVPNLVLEGIAAFAYSKTAL